MQYVINEDIVRDTTKCRKDFSCLFGAHECLCQIEECLSNKFYFVRPETDTDLCNYRIRFGNYYVCSCSTRKELYKRYTI